MKKTITLIITMMLCLLTLVAVTGCDKGTTPPTEEKVDDNGNGGTKPETETPLDVSQEYDGIMEKLCKLNKQESTDYSLEKTKKRSDDSFEFEGKYSYDKTLNSLFYNEEYVKKRLSDGGVINNENKGAAAKKEGEYFCVYDWNRIKSNESYHKFLAEERSLQGAYAYNGTQNLLCGGVIANYFLTEFDQVEANYIKYEDLETAWAQATQSDESQGLKSSYSIKGTKTGNVKVVTLTINGENSDTADYHIYSDYSLLINLEITIKDDKITSIKEFFEEKKSYNESLIIIEKEETNSVITYAEETPKYSLPTEYEDAYKVNCDLHFYTKQVDGVNYDFRMNKEGTEIELTNVENDGASVIGKELVIPDDFYGLPVTSLGSIDRTYSSLVEKLTLPAKLKSISSSLLKDWSVLKEISIPGTVKVIEEAAFENCSLLTSVTFPSSVEIIGKSAFKNCGKLNTVVFSDGVKEIGDSAFYQCAFTSLVFPNTLTEIGAKAFEYCCDLESVTLREGIQEIGDNAFYGSQITKLEIPSSIEIAGYNICPNTVAYNNIYGISYLGNSKSPYLVAMRFTDVEKVNNYCTLTKNTKVIASGAFRNSAIKTLVIPSSVTSIGSGAFEVCDDLESVTLNEGLKHIGAKAFYQYTPVLKSIKIPNSIQSVGAGAFRYSEKINLSYYGMACYLKDNLMYIGNDDNKYLVAVGLYDKSLGQKGSVVDEKTRVIADEIGISSGLTIKRNVKYISRNAFRNASSVRFEGTKEEFLQWIGDNDIDVKRLPMTVYCSDENYVRY